LQKKKKKKIRDFPFFIYRNKLLKINKLKHA
jgi:hypothetical protein